MEARIFKVEITTPQKKWNYDDVISCSAPGVQGSFQVLYDHAPLLSQLTIGEIKLETQNGVSYFATSGGFLEVLNNNVSLLLETSEELSNIDIARAEAAAQRARGRLKQNEEDIDVERARLALARATNRLRIAKRNVSAA